MERRLVELRQPGFEGWVCSECGHVFITMLDCVPTGLTLDEIIGHFKVLREQAFAKHRCPSSWESRGYRETEVEISKAKAERMGLDGWPDPPNSQSAPYENRSGVMAMPHQINAKEEERVCAAKEYCEGYAYGVCEGRRCSAPKADAGQPSYRAGFARGVTAAQRTRQGESSAAGGSKDIASDAVRRPGDDRRPLAQTLTEEQSNGGQFPQRGIGASAEKGWQDILLELYRRLLLFEDLAILAAEEEAAIEVVRAGIVKRLAKTCVVLPIPG